MRSLWKMTVRRRKRRRRRHTSDYLITFDV
jgi:hypothetical protein